MIDFSGGWAHDHNHTLGHTHIEEGLGHHRVQDAYEGGIAHKKDSYKMVFLD